MTEPELPGYDLTGYLADQIDAFAGMIEQRDLARSVAVGLEGELHAVEIERDALIAKLNGAAEKVREFAEYWLFDAERDCPMVAYEPAIDLADSLEFEAKFQ